MLNKIFIMGRLTRDPELRRTQSGTPVTSFSLAVDRDFKSQSGEKETDFIDVVAWRATAMKAPPIPLPAHRPTVRLPAALRLPWAATLPRLTTRTATCRSDPVFRNTLLIR